jgi:hypothetical protein
MALAPVPATKPDRAAPTKIDLIDFVISILREFLPV